MPGWGTTLRSSVRWEHTIKDFQQRPTRPHPLEHAFILASYKHATERDLVPHPTSLRSFWNGWRIGAGTPNIGKQRNYCDEKRCPEVAAVYLNKNGTSTPHLLHIRRAKNCTNDNDAAPSHLEGISTGNLLFDYTGIVPSADRVSGTLVYV